MPERETERQTDRETERSLISESLSPWLVPTQMPSHFHPPPPCPPRGQPHHRQACSWSPPYRPFRTRAQCRGVGSDKHLHVPLHENCLLSFSHPKLHPQLPPLSYLKIVFKRSISAILLRDSISHVSPMDTCYEPNLIKHGFFYLPICIRNIITS